MKTRRKKIKKEIIPKPLKIILVFLLLLYVLFKIADQSIRITKLRTEKELLEKEKLNIQAEIDEIEYDIKHKDSLEFAEKMAREKLGMLKKNEKIYVDIENGNRSVD